MQQYEVPLYFTVECRGHNVVVSANSPEEAAARVQRHIKDGFLNPGELRDDPAIDVSNYALTHLPLSERNHRVDPGRPLEISNTQPEKR